jgi:hypothetical protein
MKILYPVSLALGLTFASASSAEQFVIDPLQSYIEVDLETWVQGEPWGFINEESGELSVMGYAWDVETQTMRYALSGHFEWVDSGLRQDPFVGVNLGDIELQADTPKPWQLELPPALAYDAMTGEIVQQGDWLTPCPEEIDCHVSNWTLYTPYTTSLFGQRNEDEIRITGVQNRISVSYLGTFTGGFAPPSEIPLPDDPIMRYSIVATAVPEPAQFGLLLASVPLVWWSARRRRQLG